MPYPWWRVLVDAIDKLPFPQQASRDQVASARRRRRFRETLDTLPGQPCSICFRWEGTSLGVSLNERPAEHRVPWDFDGPPQPY
jgi:hypothetical protein